MDLERNWKIIEFLEFWKQVILYDQEIFQLERQTLQLLDDLTDAPKNTHRVWDTLELHSTNPVLTNTHPRIKRDRMVIDRIIQ